MDLTYPPEAQAFRQEIRSWLTDHLPEGWGTDGFSMSESERQAFGDRWTAMLFEGGWICASWPPEYGGKGLSLIQQVVLHEEFARAGAPLRADFFGDTLVGPTLLEWGTEEQKREFIPRILNGTIAWCQGFSEPDAGSDLASLRTRAVRDGDHYVVNGSKIWTSFAEVADFCELLVRTGPDGSRHRGITWLIMPMDAPGIEIRPLRTIAGSTEFAELYLDDVRVPVDMRVGEEDDGWRVTMVTLGFERGTAFVGELLQSMELLHAIREAADALEGGAGVLAAAIGHLGAELDALWALTRRNVSVAARTGVPGVGGSVFKLAFSELRQRLGELGMELAGRTSLSRDELGSGNAELVDTWVNSFSRTIAAGTSQIQRNIVAERILGLPKGAP